MKNTLLEYIILYLLVFCVALVVATLARLSALSLGADSFTAFVVFIIVLIVLSIVYFSIHLVLQDLLLPLISNKLNKTPFFRNKNKITSNLLNLDEIRKDNGNKAGKELESAIYYTQKLFAPYAADEEIKRLCEYISLYANKQKFNGLKPIQITNQLTTLDIYHYGWIISESGSKKTLLCC
jgi:hypothetical protein